MFPKQQKIFSLFFKTVEILNYKTTDINASQSHYITLSNKCYIPITQLRRSYVITSTPLKPKRSILKNNNFIYFYLNNN